MDFNDTTNETGICQEVDFLCGTDVNSFPLKDKARMANRWNYRAVIWQREASVGWKWDDPNHSTLDVARETLVADQEQYTLDATILGIESVEILDENGNYYEIPVRERSSVEGSFSEYKETSGRPEEAFLTGNAIILKPAPATGQFTASEGLKLTVTRETNAFVSTDTTQEPSFLSPFHRIVPLGIAADWLTTSGELDLASAYMLQVNELKEELQEFVSGRVIKSKARVSPAHRPNDYI